MVVGQAHRGADEAFWVWWAGHSAECRIANTDAVCPDYAWSVAELRNASVPFVDLGRTHASLKVEILRELDDLMEAGAFVNGPAVERFEAQFALNTGAARCVGMSSGLDALRIGLIAAGLERGEEVIVPAMTFVATLEAVTQAGGVPVVVDIQESDFNLDPDAAGAAVTGSTRFVLPVHLYGQLADLGRLGTLGLPLIEDACQAPGAVRDGLRAGSGGLAAAFSFYPTKNLGAMGDAGALVTDDDALADMAVALREHGQRRKYEHEAQGYTARLDTFQAIVLLRKLPLLERWNEERRRIANRYFDALDAVGDLRLPPVPEGSEPVWHLFVVRTADPDSLAAHLADRGVQSGRHYPAPVHLTEAYAYLAHPTGAFPVAESLGRECLSLPIFPGMHEDELDRVVDAVRSFFGNA
jgi:dTDP-4-amino-4,6-dideoxygalactose transaminase